jgi:hypothetical protein
MRCEVEKEEGDASDFGKSGFVFVGHSWCCIGVFFFTFLYGIVLVLFLELACFGSLSP